MTQKITIGKTKWLLVTPIEVGVTNHLNITGFNRWKPTDGLCKTIPAVLSMHCDCLQRSPSEQMFDSNVKSCEMPGGFTLCGA